MDREWILQTKETRRTFSSSTWVPLRESTTNDQGEIKEIGFISEYFGCGSVAFPPEYKDAAERLCWSDIGISQRALPYAYKDGYYTTIDQYQIHDKEPIGVNLVFDHPQPVVGGRLWTLNPDLVVALGLIKEGNNWVRPEEDFVIVARETLDKSGQHIKIEIKREFLLDYLAARNLSLRLSYYRQRVENVAVLSGSSFDGLENEKTERDNGRFELLIRTLEKVYGGSWSTFRIWRTDLDEEDDAPVMAEEGDGNTDSETSKGYSTGYDGTRVEGEFWRDEWIVHQSQSVRVRGDLDQTLPQFIVGTDGARMASTDLNTEDIRRWLWFRPSIVNELLNHRGFSLDWYTAETGGINSTSGCSTHFGINSSDLITVYAYDIAKLAAWEQRVWAAHNVVPEGKVSSELIDSQVKAKPASTEAVEIILLQAMRMLESEFKQKYNISLFNHDIDDKVVTQQISRFVSKDLSSLLKLAKEIVRVFSDRLNSRELRKLSKHADKEKLGSNKLLQDVVAQEIGDKKAREIFGVIAGTYDMRIGDAHPTGSKISDALKLAEVDDSLSYLRQGEQLIHNFTRAIWWVGESLFGQPEKKSK